MQLAELRRRASEEPDTGARWLDLALALDARGREAEAIPFYVKALRLGVTSERRRIALFSLTSSYRETGQRDRAVKTAQVARREFRGHPVVESFHALILVDCDQARRALRILGLALLGESDADGRWGGWIPIGSASFNSDPQAAAASDGHDQRPPARTAERRLRGRHGRRGGGGRACGAALERRRDGGRGAQRLGRGRGQRRAGGADTASDGLGSQVADPRRTGPMNARSDRCGDPRRGCGPCRLL